MRARKGKKKRRTTSEKGEPPQSTGADWLAKELEHKHFFALTTKTRNALRKLAEQNHFPRITAWSFVLHPEVLKALANGADRLRRYIIIIDTLDNQVYAGVKKLLLNQRANVTAFSCGGWADFLLDVYLRQSSYRRLIKSIEETMIASGLAQADVADLISIYEVEEPLILCRKRVEDLARPSAKTVQRIVDDRIRFETVLRNYLSDETNALFNKPTKVRAYLDELDRENAIVCYRSVADFPRFFNQDYVPIDKFTVRDVRNLLDAARSTHPDLTRPILELLRVKSLRRIAHEEPVGYVSINQYGLPGERLVWKEALYEWAKTRPVNVYNWPLEGVVCQAPMVFSDAPELDVNIRAYERAGAPGILLGKTCHPDLLDICRDVSLPISGLAQHGIILGQPGQGKTSTGVALVAKVASLLPRVVVIDGTGGVSPKLAKLPTTISSRVAKHVVQADANLDQRVETILQDKGISLIQPSADDVGEVVDSCMRGLSGQLSGGDKERDLHGFILFEEAGDVLSIPEAGSRAKNLCRLLEKAWRFGWSVWLSSQRVTSLGPDSKTAVQILKLLRNRLIHRIDDRQELDLLCDTFEQEGASETELTAVRSMTPRMGAGEVLCRAAVITEGSSGFLPIVPVRVQPLSEIRATL